MDIEQLNKSQIVMLTMLVSFMTSIATGIVTVSLMQQAPLAITETVNRVVERTVEKVVPGQPASVMVPVKETVLIKESDAIAQAVEKTAPSIVRIYTSDASTSVFLALGLVVDSAGTIATDADAVTVGKEVAVEVAGSMRVRGKVTVGRKSDGVAFIAAATSTPDTKAVAWKPFSLPAQHATIGQTVVVVGGKSVARVGQGIVTAVNAPESKDAAEILETSIPKDSIFPGSPVIDSDGNVVGISTAVSRAVSESSFIPSTQLMPIQKPAADPPATN